MTESLVENEETTTLELITLELNPAVVRGIVKRPSDLAETSLSISLGGEVTQSQDERACVEGVDCLEEARCEGEGGARSCLQPLGYYEFSDLVSGDYSLEVRAVDNPRLRPQTFPYVRAIAGESVIIPTIELERAVGELQGTVRLLGLSEERAQGANGFSAVRAAVTTEEGRVISLNVDPISAISATLLLLVSILVISHPSS